MTPSPPAQQQQQQQMNEQTDEQTNKIVNMKTFRWSHSSPLFETF